MCFSSEASLTAAALLTVIGYAAVSETKQRKQIYLALIPVIFALQQLAEGVLWLTLDHGYYPSLIADLAEGVFLFIAFITWPIWLPISLYMLETDWRKKRIILIAFIAGLVFGIGNLVGVVGHPLVVKQVGHSLQYDGYLLPSEAYYWTIKAVYIFAVIMPCWISSFPMMRLWGTLLLILYALAEYFFFATSSSVWCFFAAVLSALLFIIIKRANR